MTLIGRTISAQRPHDDGRDRDDHEQRPQAELEAAAGEAGSAIMRSS